MHELLPPSHRTLLRPLALLSDDQRLLLAAHSVLQLLPATCTTRARNKANATCAGKIWSLCSAQNLGRWSLHGTCYIKNEVSIRLHVAAAPPASLVYNKIHKPVLLLFFYSSWTACPSSPQSLVLYRRLPTLWLMMTFLRQLVLAQTRMP